MVDQDLINSLCMQNPDNPFVYNQVQGEGANSEFIKSFDEALIEAEGFTEDEAIDLYDEIVAFFEQTPNKTGDSTNFKPLDSKKLTKQKTPLFIQHQQTEPIVRRRR